MSGDVGQEVDDRVDAAGVDEQRVGELGQDADVGLAGRAQVTDQRCPLALEHRHQPGDGALDRLLEDDVGLVEAGRRPVTGVVADLDPEGGPGGHRPPGGRCPGQRTGGHRRRRGLSGADGIHLGRGGFVAPGEDQGHHHADQQHRHPADRIRPSPGSIAARAPLLAAIGLGLSLELLAREHRRADRRRGSDGGGRTDPPFRFRSE